MTERTLEGKKVACLATNGFEYSELTRPVSALREVGAEVSIVSPEKDEIWGVTKMEKEDGVKVDSLLEDVKSTDYDALLIPGGVFNTESLRTNPEAVRFVRDFFEQKKPVSSICHGAQLLIEADVLRGRKLTSYPALRKDCENAGASWFDEDCIVDQGLTTSRTPEDLDAFIRKTIEEFGEGKHSGQKPRENPTTSPTG